MDLMSTMEHGGNPLPVSLPPGVTPITELKQQKRASRTLSKAVSLHLEGKLDTAAQLLAKAIEDGEREPGLYSALGHIQYEMRDLRIRRRHLCATGEAGSRRTAPRTSTWASARAI